jgi:molecular chaperone GrpE
MTADAKPKSSTGKLVKQLEQQLAEAKQKELRAQADYQNLIRRSQQERTAVVKMAARDLIDDLLQPLSHLELAAAQLNDAGLNMVVQQFRSVLSQHGVEEIEALGQTFDVATMEVVEAAEDAPQDHSQAKVIAVRSKGYRLNGQVIQHAKVVIGK